MLREEPERRRAPRRVPQPGDALARVRLRTGRELAVVDISACGVLVEGSTRLVPGTHAEVHVVTRHGRTLVRTRVVRAFVSHLDADAVCYRSALAFETNVDTETDGYPLPGKTPVFEGGAGNAYPNIEVPERA
jgi:hypothetical protein